MRPASTPFGTIRLAHGRRTQACASIICCCRRRPPTGSSPLASTSMCAAGKSRRTMCRHGSSLRWTRRRSRNEDQDAAGATKRRSVQGGRAPQSLIVAAIEPALEVNQRNGALVGGRLLQRRGVELGDPALPWKGRIAGESEPHQATRCLAWHVIALEQHRAQHRLGLILPLIGGKREPARGLFGLAQTARAVEIHAAEMIL